MEISSLVMLVAMTASLGKLEVKASLLPSNLEIAGSIGITWEGVGYFCCIFLAHSVSDVYPHHSNPCTE